MASRFIAFNRQSINPIRSIPKIERNFIMAKTKSEKIASIQEQIAQLENQLKRLMQQQKEQERKDRTKRFCKRMGLFESMLPDTISLTDEQFKIFLKKTVTTEYSRRILDGLTPQTADITAPQGAETAAQGERAEALSSNPKGALIYH